MAEYQLEIESRIIGGNPELPKLEPVLLRFNTTVITVADLIRRAVEEYVWTLVSNRRMEAEEARRLIQRHYLTESEVATQAQRGAVRLPSSRQRKPIEIDVEMEVQKALHAFESGTYFIVVDGRQAHSLTDGVTLGQASRAEFIRLVPLAGG